jgi:hypothetical protein
MVLTPWLFANIALCSTSNPETDQLADRRQGWSNRPTKDLKKLSYGRSNYPEIETGIQI